MERLPKRTLPKVSEEILKGMPTLADLNALSAIVFPAVIADAVAAIQHRGPAYEGWRNAPDARVPVFDIEKRGATRGGNIRNCLLHHA